ncbi:unnamed protein product [Moneuplotes crassus]|uniref:Uncharacterized protein n=1 Tax=Euplotes crassus TaxID=5936 RepID=A0AAD1Y7N0_EUPCR|nr:unnamed protein product [Moneuplotes crassus]|mmetsp:Transcript_4032/g.3813  ORF Transcript_4032/g.3813 Transcript_4032/m.3813 type:complete len:95 (+) Transcript_4032:12-296(+)
MVNRPTWFRFYEFKSNTLIVAPKSTYGNIAAQISVGAAFALTMLLARIVFKEIDQYPIWQRRLHDKRTQKMAFDWMIKVYAEKEESALNEFSLY